MPIISRTSEAPDGDCSDLEQVELVVLGDCGRPCLVAQRRPCQDWFEVVARRRSPASARAWVEAHYEGVRWSSPVESTARIGRLRARRW